MKTTWWRKKMKTGREGGNNEEEEAEERQWGEEEGEQKEEEMKEWGPCRRQRPTCLKSLKARSNVSPWKPATGPALAKPVGKYKPTPPPVHPRREGREEEEEEEEEKKKQGEKTGILKDLVGFAMHRDRLADEWQRGGTGGTGTGGSGGARVMSLAERQNECVRKCVDVNKTVVVTLADFTWVCLLCLRSTLLACLRSAGESLGL